MLARGMQRGILVEGASVDSAAGDDPPIALILDYIDLISGTLSLRLGLLHRKEVSPCAPASQATLATPRTLLHWLCSGSLQ